MLVFNEPLSTSVNIRITTFFIQMSCVIITNEILNKGVNLT